jgi:hypothetical protein
MIEQDETTGRFAVVETKRGAYRVVDTVVDTPLLFSYDVTRIPHASTVRPPAEWRNYYCARGFAQKMSALHK